jgi:hypothetical protein
MAITKHSSYSPKQSFPVSPAKAWSDKLKVNSYYPNGRGCEVEGEAPSNAQTFDVTRRRDKGE